MTQVDPNRDTVRLWPRHRDKRDDADNPLGLEIVL